MSREFGRWVGAAVVVMALFYVTPLFGPVVVVLIGFMAWHEMTVAGKRARSRRRRR